MNDILNKIKAIDSEKMYKSINSFPVQIEKSYDLKVQNIMKNISITEGILYCECNSPFNK